MKQYTAYIKAIKNDLIVIGILLIMSWKIMHGFEYFIDVGVADEADYLRNGLNILKNGIGRAEYGPLYKIWYYILSLFEPDRVQLYYFNIKIQSILLPILSYMLLRRLYVPILESGIIAGLLLTCNGNLFTDPRMAQLVIIISLLFFFLTTYVHSFASSTLILSIGALLSSYVRPEFFVTYLLFSALFCAVVFFEKERTLRRFHLLVLFFLCSVPLIIYLGIPAFSNNSVRSYIAFSDHFALNWVSWTKSDVNPWWVVIPDGGEITDQTFGHARSIFAAAIYNPSMFGKHVISNLQNLVKTLYWLLDPQYNRMFQLYGYGFSYKNFEIFFLFIITGIYLYNIRERWMSKIMMKEKIGNYKQFLIYFLIYSIPGLISAIVFFPRQHYLVLSSVLFVIGIAIVFTS